MNREAAAELAADALELANAGDWAELLAMELPSNVLELMRQKAQLNKQVEHLEQQETVLWELIIQLLIEDQP
jgi:hypothetical protein